jgi:signal transduction histidine kinase
VAYRGTKYDYGFCDLRLMMGTLIRYCRSQKHLADIEFEFKAEKEFPKKLFVKGIQIQNILMNIIINAAQAFEKTPDREDKKITIELIRPKDEDDSALIQISDNGPGMVETDLNKVFKERFSTKTDGLGLSLLNSKKIIESHGGEIRISSYPGRGTNLEIMLPLRSVKRDD